MAYLGTPIDTTNQFQSLQGKRFSGDGSTTAFTLDIAPSSVFDIEVFVENVRQDPNSAYGISGTTLTFTGAPPSGTNNIYVVHQAKAVGTIDVPASGVVPASLASNIISGQTELAVPPATTDEFLISDAGTLKRIDASLVVGNTKQIVTTQTGAVATGTTLFPEDDTIPQNTEGDQYMSLAITPKLSTSRLLITAQVFGSVSSGTRWGIGLFKDSTADALSFATAFVKDATSMATCYIEHSLISGSTSEQTFKIRAGAFGSATFTFNGQSGSRKFGGTILSSIHITEIEV